jgi:hypothetical protein
MTKSFRVDLFEPAYARLSAAKIAANVMRFIVSTQVLKRASSCLAGMLLCATIGCAAEPARPSAVHPFLSEIDRPAVCVGALIGTCGEAPEQYLYKVICTSLEGASEVQVLGYGMTHVSTSIVTDAGEELRPTNCTTKLPTAYHGPPEGIPWLTKDGFANTPMSRVVAVGIYVGSARSFLHIPESERARLQELRPDPPHGSR